MMLERDQDQSERGRVWMRAPGGVRRAVTGLGHALWRPWLRRRLDRTALETIEGLPIVVLPRVFNPAVFRSGTLLARAVGDVELETAPGRRQPRVLDLGTGSGVGALFAARRGLRVTAVDVNPQAVRCARANALLHGLEKLIEVRHGDLFAPVLGQRFELVLFNPPFFRGEPRHPLDAAWRSPDVLDRFAAGLPSSLAADGRALVVLSTDGAGEALLETLARRGFELAPALRRRYGNEELTAWSVSRTSANGSAFPSTRSARHQPRTLRAGRRRLWRSRTSS